MNARHSKRSLGFAAVATIAALGATNAAAQVPTPSDAAAAGACLHLGGLVGCPNNPTSSVPLPPGSGSAFFTLQGGTQGTVWNIFGGGSTIFIPSTTFPPFLPPIPTPPVVTPTPTPIPTPPIIPPVTTPTTPTTPSTPSTPVIANPFTLDPLASISGPARTPPIMRPEFSVSEAFAAIRIPIIEDTLPRYSDYGLSEPGAPTYSITGAWAPVRDIRFRGNYSRAVRAPNVGELFAPPGGIYLAPEPPAFDPSALPDRADLIHNVYIEFLSPSSGGQTGPMWVGSVNIPANPSTSADANGTNISDYYATSLTRGFDPNGFGFQGLPIEPILLEGGVTFIPFVVIPDNVAFGEGPTAAPSSGPPAGDFNGDGAVDAADYIVWRNSGGSPDAYETWKENFGNSTGAGAGGGIFGGGSATPTIPGNTLGGPGPLQDQGGGVFSAPGQVTIGNATLSGNTAGTPPGGGIRVDKPLTVTGSTLANNTAGGAQTGEGGGISVDQAPTIAGTSVSSNTSGGAQAGANGGVSGTPQPAPTDQNNDRAAFIRDQAQSIARRLTSGTPEEQAQAQKNLDQWGNQELKDAVEQAKRELQAPPGRKTAKVKSKLKSKRTAFRRRPILRSPFQRMRTAQIQTDAGVSVIPTLGGFAR